MLRTLRLLIQVYFGLGRIKGGKKHPKRALVETNFMYQSFVEELRELY